LEDLQSIYIFVDCCGAVHCSLCWRGLSVAFQASSFNITDLYHYDFSVTNVLMMVVEVTETSTKMSFIPIQARNEGGIWGIFLPRKCQNIA